MVKKAKQILAALLIAVFGLQTASCGWVLYPERKGQRGGRIDPAVAILDGVGLLLFLIPGVVAFIIDFHYGTIYLPGTKSAEAEAAPLRTVKFNGDLTPEEIEIILARETGSKVDLETAQVQLVRVRSKDEIRTLLSTAEAGGG